MAMRHKQYDVVKEISIDERHHDRFELSLPRRACAARKGANNLEAVDQIRSIKPFCHGSSINPETIPPRWMGL